MYNEFKLCCSGLNALETADFSLETLVRSIHSAARPSPSGAHPWGPGEWEGLPVRALLVVCTCPLGVAAWPHALPLLLAQALVLHTLTVRGEPHECTLQRRRHTKLGAEAVSERELLLLVVLRPWPCQHHPHHPSWQPVGTPATPNRDQRRLCP